MDFLSTVLPSDHSAWFPVIFMGFLAVGLIAGALIARVLRRVTFMTHFSVRALLTVAGIAATVAIAVPAFAALNGIALLPAAALLTFTIAIVVCLGDPANIWDAEQKKWVVSLGK